MTKFKLLLAATAIAGAAWTLSAVNDRDDEKRERREVREKEGDREHDRERPRETDRERKPASELEVWVNQMERKIAELKKAGKAEAAGELTAKVRQVIAQHRERQAERREHEGREGRDKPKGQDAEVRAFLQEAEKKIHALLKAGKREEAEKLRAHVREELAKHQANQRHAEREREGEGGDAKAKRLRHIGAAIEHLQAAGLRDWAEELAAHARELRGEGHNERQREREREEPEHREREREGQGNDQLRRQVQELQQALEQIQRQLRERRERD